MQAAALSAPGAAPAQVLPRLRDDLSLLPGPAAENGGPTWTIHDPVRNRYYRIGAEAFALLRHWQRGEAMAVLSAAATQLGRPLAGDRLEAMLRFLDGNNLLRREDSGGITKLVQARAAQRHHWATWLLHNYLFIRIPLLRPDKFLSQLAPKLDFLFSRGAALIIAGIALLGLYLASRQWDQFWATLPDMASWQGLLYFGIALGLAKSIHEMGHALMAKRQGCRVPSMGIAFMVLYPVLYTDVTDAWRLTERRPRLLIGAAGMMAEGSLAAFALLAWSLLPEGPLRSVAFSLAAVSFIATVAINASPFMRFDGYYLLADWLGVENLQERAFALARWHLRETLFGLGLAPPEVFPPRRQKLLIAYAYITWVYRLILFIGIAALVYYFFFKLLGILLFVVEVVWFILRPIWTEMRAWWQQRRLLRPNRRLLATLLLAGIGLAAFITPWRGEVTMPAMLRASEYAMAYAPVNGRVEEVLIEREQRVVAGTPLLRLAAPDLDHDLILTQQRIAILDLQIARAAASPDVRRQMPVLREQRASLERRRAGLEELRGRLLLRANVDGSVVEILKGLRPGLWVEPRQPLLLLADRQRIEAVAYLDETDIRRLEPGAAARFVPLDNAAESFPLRVSEIAAGTLDSIDVLALSSLHGGPLPARKEADGRERPSHGLYRVVLVPEGKLEGLERSLRGTVLAEAPAQSFARRLFDQTVAVLLRESGF